MTHWATKKNAANPTGALKSTKRSRPGRAAPGVGRAFHATLGHYLRAWCRRHAINRLLSKTSVSSRDRLRIALDHREPDRIPLDFGSTAVTGIHVNCVAALREHYGLTQG